MLTDQVLQLTAADLVRHRFDVGVHCASLYTQYYDVIIDWYLWSHLLPRLQT